MFCVVSARELLASVAPDRKSILRIARVRLYEISYRGGHLHLEYWAIYVFLEVGRPSRGGYLKQPPLPPPPKWRRSET